MSTMNDPIRPEEALAEPSRPFPSGPGRNVSPADEIRASMRPRGSRGKTPFEIASRDRPRGPNDVED
jgi:hypothetical protein